MEENKKIKIVNVKKRPVGKKNIIHQRKNQSVTKIIITITVLIVIAIGSFFMINAIKKGGKNLSDKNLDQSVKTGKVVDTELLNEEFPASAEIITQGRFNSIEQNVKGKALFFKNDGEIYLRLEGFETINAQDLHVYLSPILNLDKSDAIDLGMLKAVSGDFNYQLEKNIDIEKYKNVIIWSNPFDAFFGYASLISKELPPEPENIETTNEEENQQDTEDNSEETSAETSEETGETEDEVDNIEEETAPENETETQPEN